ncbi:L-asparaginase [Asanoa ishikariensis]|uniref:L-asparaginase n=1 Tax=Asanoa ishikariensis TaxID=137265 RepID=A0A1H3LST8_9ACTN|nr:asparaginase [Asanoa ishikariensis]GIF65651.1 L-asparaginase [Asanoa ishikariensis]SDY67048.1 L-asparaginase [Asanoa ishikariensis]
MPTVAVFSLGGTIAMTTGPDGGVVPALGAADLVAAVPGLADTGISVEVTDFRRLPGAGLGFADLAALVAAASGTGADGVVVTQGTDTIEEAAYALDLLWTLDTPLVVTGAMRNPTLAGADGPANLLAAVRVAAAPEARGMGCLVVLGDEIHAARWVRKTHTTSPAAFRSPDTGPVGLVAEGRPRILTRPVRHSLRIDEPIATVRTGVVPVVLGDDGELLRQAGVVLDGLVVAAFGVGHVPVSTVDVLTDLARSKPVVLASRIGAGPVLTHTYGYPGAEADLLRRGLIAAGALDPYKARILLHLLLAAGHDRAGVVNAFAAVNGRASEDARPLT